LQVDGQHLLHELLLPQVDLAVGHRGEQRVEDPAGDGVITRMAGHRTSFQVLIDRGRIGLPHLASRLGEAFGSHCCPLTW